MKKIFLLSIIFIMLLMLKCGSSVKEISDMSNPDFCLTDTMKNKIQLDTVCLNYVQNTLNLSGKIQPLPSKNIRIFPLVSGVVKEVYVELGDYVVQGQNLAQIISSEVAEFEKELTDAEANLQIAMKNLDVAKDMFKSRLISEKEMTAANKELEKAEAEVKRLKSVFNIYQIDAQGYYTLKAPISGYIITKNISSGMQIRSDNNDEILSIADINTLWVVASVYESDMQKIRTEQDAVIYTIAYPDSTFKGKVNKIFEALDPVTRVMKIAIEIKNRNNLLKPEMYARVVLSYTDKSKLPAISSKAVIFDNSKYYVLVYKDDCSIEVRNVEIEVMNRNLAYIRNGLNPGEQVITKNNLLIYSAITQSQ